VNADWERGYAAGYAAAHRSDVRDITTDRGMATPAPKEKKARKVSAYGRRYGIEYKRLKAKHPRMSFGALSKKAHAATRKAMK
jgi:glutamate synthase domain-containing protein 2